MHPVMNKKQCNKYIKTFSVIKVGYIGFEGNSGIKSRETRVE